jgi:hypothetical protein
MRKRRVGVTARSRLIEGNQATGSLEVDTEMAAPLELRTPTSTAGPEWLAECGWKRGDKGAGVNGQKANPQRLGKGSESGDLAPGSGALKARMRRCLILRQGASPLRPPAPFPSALMLQNGGNLSRVRKPRKTGAPLTDRLRSEESLEMRERGPKARGSIQPPVGRPRKDTKLRTKKP